MQGAVVAGLGCTHLVRESIKIIQATVEVAGQMKIRDVDRQEVLAMSGRSPEEGLIESVNVSCETWAGMVDGKPIAIFGVAPINILAGVGSPWLLGSDDIESHAFEFLRLSRPIIDHMHQTFPVLFNFVDQRNMVSQRWLRWMGFFLHDPITIGIEGRQFIPFERVRKNV